MNNSSEYISVRILPAFLARCVLFIALVVLLGWTLDIPILKSLLPDFVAMNPTSVLLFIICSLALWIHQVNGQDNRSSLSGMLGVFVVSIAAIRLAGYNTRFDIGIDQLLFRSQLSGNRMAPNTALAFLFTGLSLWFLNRKMKHGFLFSQVIALLASAISILAIVGYLYVDRTLYKVATYIPMALHTAISFVLLTTGILFASSRHGIMSVVMHKNVGGKMSRTLLPITLLIPVLFGWLGLKAQDRGLVNLPFGTALMAISIMMVFTVLVWALAWSINSTDKKRKMAESGLLFAKTEAEDSKRIQQQFLANMSHEIRTPINGVIGMVQLMSTTSLSTEQKEYIDIINESASNLLVIINDILDVTKMQVGKIALEEVNYSLRDLVRNLVKIFSFKSAIKRIDLNWDIAPEVPAILLGDPVRLTQILTNLINNAIKFTEKGEVKLSICLLEENADITTLQFLIKDTGIGIAEDKIERVFESFTQASDDTTRIYGGTGLGLTISKQLIELQGGLIALSSTLGEGSTFSFFLPIKKSVAIQLEKAVEKPIAPAMDQLRILLAEDNLINQKVASKLLCKKGALVDIANNGSEVLEMLAKGNYHIILMDINMPVMDGFEATRSIRESGASFQQIPIIALTASALATEKTMCIEMGMDDYLSKPFKVEDLFEKINAQLASAV